MGNLCIRYSTLALKWKDPRGYFEISQTANEIAINCSISREPSIASI